MITVSRLAGFFAAHALWCVSGNETLIPMLAYTTADGERKMERLVSSDLPESVALGKRRLNSNEMDGDDAALLYDGRIDAGEEKLDAVIIEMRAYFAPDSEAVIAVPYMPASSGRFLVHRPKLLLWENCEDFDLEAALQSFFESVSEHEPGSKVWKDCLDESK